MAEGLMCRHKDLRLDLQNPCKKPRVMERVYNPNRGWGRALASQLSQTDELQDTLRISCLKKEWG